jgi:hypothetical protein
LSTYNCGIINGYKEIYRAESCAQTLAFILNLIEISPQPKFIAYDAGCILSKFIHNEKRIIDNTTSRFLKLLEKVIVVDKFHFKHHSLRDKYCQKKCNPNKYSELNLINTEATEQNNSWLSSFKAMFKHMNQSRFKFILYDILNDYNYCRLYYSINVTK